MAQSDWSNLGNPDDVMETSLTIDYDKQWLNCVSAISVFQQDTRQQTSSWRHHDVAAKLYRPQF